MREALARGWREHFLWVLQNTRRAYHPARRRIDLHIEAAEVVVELRWPEVWISIPTAQVIVHRNARVPLRDLRERVTPGAHAHAALPFDFRYAEIPLDVELRCTL